MALGEAYEIHPYFLGMIITHVFLGIFNNKKIHWETLTMGNIGFALEIVKHEEN